MRDSILTDNARKYAELLKLEVDFETPLGYGNDGKVWRTSRRTAIKAMESKRKYDLELTCYQRFAIEEVTQIGDFSVPALINFDEKSLIIEMSIVSPPYIIDFAKVWLDTEPDFPEDAIRTRLEQAEEDFGDDWPKVAELLATLRWRFGIHYSDPNLGNIRLRADGPSPS